MVAICTGPAFSTDDAGNLILAGERRKANPSPCALKDGNGLYTDPSGGAWAVDQVSLCSTQNYTANSGKQVSGGASVPWDTATFTYTNGTCWPLMVNVLVCWKFFCWISAKTTMWFETGSAVDNPSLGYTVMQSQAYYPDSASGVNAPTYMDWLGTHTQIIAHIRMEPHSTHKFYAGARLSARFGTGGTLQYLNYMCSAWGYAVI